MQGSGPRNHLLAAGALGISLFDDGRIDTSAHQEMAMPRCCAAGDVVSGLNQIAVAMAHTEIAAVDIHNKLRRDENLTLA